MNQYELPKILNLADTAEYLSTKESHVRALVFKNEIPHFKLGRLLRFEIEKLDNWIKENSHEGE